ncbi:MAG: hypothetical protein QOC92_4493 [Acidimicrobiaceae bacterium]|jgi:hypothetical protein
MSRPIEDRSEAVGVCMRGPDDDCGPDDPLNIHVLLLGPSDAPLNRLPRKADRVVQLRISLDNASEHNVVSLEIPYDEWLELADVHPRP